MKRLLIGIALLISSYSYADIAVTQGSGTNIATDNVSSVNYQKLKIYDGTPGSTNGMKVDTSGKAQVSMVALSSATMNIVSVSTANVTQVDSTLLSGRVSIETQNIDPSANLWCGFNNSVTINNGRKIVPSSAWSVSVASTIPVYCISDGAGSTNAAVSQAY